MLHYIEQGTLKTLSTVAGNVLYFRVPFAGKIKRVDVFCAASNISGETVFDVNIGPSPGSVISIFADPADRVRIATGQLTGAVTGLNVTVGAGYIGTLDLDSVPPGGVSAPFFLVLTVDDELSAGVSAEDVQDIVGAMLTDSTEIDFSYNDGAGTAGAALKTTGVAAGTYGTATKSARVTVDGKGRITSATEVDITSGGGDGNERDVLWPSARLFADDFNAAGVDSTLWNQVNPSYIEQDGVTGQVIFNPDSLTPTLTQLTAAQNFNLTGRFVSVKCAPAIMGAGVAGLYAYTNPGTFTHYVYLRYNGVTDKLEAGDHAGLVVNIAYDATAHAYLKISNDGAGVWSFQTSADGETWTVRGTRAEVDAPGSCFVLLTDTFGPTSFDDFTSDVYVERVADNAQLLWKAAANRYEVEAQSLAWTAIPTMQNGWVNYGAGYQVAQYRKIGDRVEVRGFIKDGTLSTVISNLPAGYWPPASLQFPACTSSGIAAIDVSGADGAIRIYGGATGYVGLAFSYSVTA
ncbi:MAG: hypothetical protein WCD76_04745 [Pyrinomonadaceae bacterium]